MPLPEEGAAPDGAAQDQEASEEHVNPSPPPPPAAAAGGGGGNDAPRTRLRTAGAQPTHDRLRYVKHLASMAPPSPLAPPGGRLPPNVQPSLLAQKLCSGANRTSSALLPTATADGLRLLGASCCQPSSSSPSTAAACASHGCIWQFGVTLLRATRVGPHGFERGLRAPALHVARVCIFDRAHHRFLGNVHTVPAADVRGARAATWTWSAAGPPREQPAAFWGGGGGGGSSGSTPHRPPPPRPEPIPPGELAGSAPALAAAGGGCGGTVAAALGAGAGPAASLAGGVAGAGGANEFVVRCASEAADPVCGVRALDGERLSLYIELNVGFPLTAEDAQAVPQAASAQGTGLVSELTACWALVSIKPCAQLAREMEISVPLYTGSIYTPGLLSAVWAADAKLHPLRSLLSSSAAAPQLIFRAGPLPPLPLVPYAHMPPTCIARRDLAYLLAAARVALGQRLAAAADAAPAAEGTAAASGARAPAAAVALGDAALAALPALLDDDVLLQELLARWWGRCRAAVAAAGAEQGDCLLSSCKGCRTAAGAPLPAAHQLQAALRASTLEVAPLLRCGSLPPPHIVGSAGQRARRADAAAAFLRTARPRSACGAAPAAAVARHPADALGDPACRCAPFDVAETRVCVAQRLAAARWSRC